MSSFKFVADVELRESLLVNGGRRLVQVLPREGRIRKYLAVSVTGTLVLLGCFLIWLQQRPIIIEGPLIELPPVELDATYVPKREFDIVVAHYSEDLASLAQTLDAIRSISSIGTPNIIIYTKHPTISLYAITHALSLPDSSVYRLPNRGREGGTYLTHILNNWDDLATHTLFLQADAHNRAYMMQRLSNYFSRNTTGYLPLGFAGEVCELTDCTDAWGWHDKYHLIPATYTLLYGALPPPGKMLLSYKGQFVVSASRVRGDGGAVQNRRKRTLEYLSGVLEGDESPYSRGDPATHFESGVETEAAAAAADDRNAPKFGFVLERMWGLVFGCADGKMALTCPSLWRARERGGSLADCQCLDR